MDKIYLVYFSPTATTQRILREIAAGINPNVMQEINLTLPQGRAQLEQLPDSEALVIFGAPVYCGRIASQAIAAIEQMQGKGQAAVCVAVYGNQRLGDALLELTDTVAAKGFAPIAAAAFIGEHSYSSQAYPIAAGRPDAQDCQLARAFGQRVQIKFQEGKLIAPKVPGERPYMPYPELTYPAPEKGEDCVQCLKCQELCPVGAINDLAEGDTSKCIYCFACVKGCPIQSRKLNRPNFTQLRKKMSVVARKEPTWFL